MLAMWGKGNPFALLVEVKIGAATMESSMEIPQKISKRSSGQDGGIGRNPLLPCTTKRRITTNLKSINKQKCQKIKLHLTPPTKVEKTINQNK